MSAIRYLSSISPLLFPKEFGGINQNLTSVFFRLHCKFTTGLLLGFSIFLGARDFFGKPIQCITSLPKNAIETYCWISSTFTMPDSVDRTLGMHPGVYTPLSYDFEEAEQNWRFHSYYQWVPFFLFFMAALCYFPHYLWSKFENGWMKCLSEKLATRAISRDKVSERNKVILGNLQYRGKMLNGYLYKYIFCEFLCLVNLIIQMILIDTFLGGEFLSYGLNVLDYSETDQKERVDPMIYVFPRMTKCHFYLFGPSGTLRRTDALCLLAHNILNEKIFIFIWFWYVTQLVMQLSLFIYRLALYLCTPLRVKVIVWRNKMVPEDKLTAIVYNKPIGLWWMLNVLSESYDNLSFRDLVNQMFDEIETKSGMNGNGNSVYPSAPFSTSAV